MRKKLAALGAVAVLMVMASTGTAQAAVDVEAAKELAKTSDCLKCHSVDKEKKGPSMQKISEKYRGNPDAQEKVIKHFTSGPTVTLPDGLEIRHRIINTKDPKEQANIADWFLSH
jgi:cytochrome c